MLFPEDKAYAYAHCILIAYSILPLAMDIFSINFALYGTEQILILFPGDIKPSLLKFHFSPYLPKVKNNFCQFSPKVWNDKIKVPHS